MGRDDQQHLQNLEAVLARLQKFGLRVNRMKCEFMQPKVRYCGHVISRDGLQMAGEKTAAV